MGPDPLQRPVFDKADREHAAELFEAVRKLSAARAGVTRPSYSEVETATLAVLASEVTPGSAGAERHGPGLAATAEFLTDHMTYPYGIHIAVVVVDPATAGCKVIRYLVGYDVGRAVNPMLVEGQLVGGVAQGIGGALFEEFRYDDAGQPLFSPGPGLPSLAPPMPPESANT